MCYEIITLWTIHPPNFSLNDGLVDYNKSEYYLNLPYAKDAYHKLWKLTIPDGQLIWCYTYEKDIVKTGIEKIKWTLRVPNSEIICFVDQLVWDRILGTIHDVGLRNMHSQWFKEWKKIPNNQPNLETYIEMREKEFRTRKPKSGNWWDELFVENPGEGISALIRHPIPTEWINCSTTWCYESTRQ